MPATEAKGDLLSGLSSIGSLDASRCESEPESGACGSQSPENGTLTSLDRLRARILAERPHRQEAFELCAFRIENCCRSYGLARHPSRLQQLDNRLGNLLSKRIVGYQQYRARFLGNASSRLSTCLDILDIVLGPPCKRSNTSESQCTPGLDR